MTESMRAVAISGSPSPDSTSRLLADRVLTLLEAHDFATELVDLSSLPADALLGRTEDAGVAGRSRPSMAPRCSCSRRRSTGRLTPRC